MARLHGKITLMLEIEMAIFAKKRRLKTQPKAQY